MILDSSVNLASINFFFLSNSTLIQASSFTGSNLALSKSILTLNRSLARSSFILSLCNSKTLCAFHPSPLISSPPIASRPHLWWRRCPSMRRAFCLPRRLVLLPLLLNQMSFPNLNGPLSVRRHIILLLADSGLGDERGDW